MQAGTLRDRVTFAQRSTVGDEYGNNEGDFVDQFTVAARVQYLRGGESVMADRLEGKQPVVLTIRMSAQAKRIETDWRATDARNEDRVFNVRSISPSERNDQLDILCETGVAV